MAKTYDNIYSYTTIDGNTDMITESEEAMYRQYIAEQEMRYDAEDAILHHWM